MNYISLALVSVSVSQTFSLISSRNVVSVDNFWKHGVLPRPLFSVTHVFPASKYKWSKTSTLKLF